jgi:hypothetical protein
MTNSSHTRNQELQPAPEERKRASRLLILQEKAACSPRASVALSAFSAVTWLREVSSLIYRRITDRRPAEKVVRPGCKVPAIPRATDLCLLIIVLTLSHGALQAEASFSAAVPRLVGYSGKLMDAEGKPLARIAGVPFAIYTDQEGGAPLWLETQTVNPDSTGHYNVQLGSSRPEGLPHDLFNSREARWLGVQVDRQAEQPRVLRVSAPYALKAADAETIGGLPPSAFVLAAPTNNSVASRGAEPSSTAVQSSSASTITGTGTANYLPLWTKNSGTLGNSVLFQSGSGSTAKIGINVAAPVASLEVQGTAMVHGQFTLPSAGIATASAGKKSFPLEDFGHPSAFG